MTFAKAIAYTYILTIIFVLLCTDMMLVEDDIAQDDKLILILPDWADVAIAW
jgi:hypothetical protein